MLWEAGPDRRGTWFNRRWLEYRGRTAAEERGEGWSDGIHPEDLGRLLEAYRDAWEEAEAFSVEYRLQGAEGEYRWVLDHGAPRVDGDGRLLGYVGACIDVHDTRSALEELRGRERQQAMVADLGRFAFEVEDEQELLDITVKLVAEGLGVPLAAVLRRTEDPAWLEIEAMTGWDETRLATRRVASDPSTLAGFSLATDGPVVTDDLPNETRFRGGPGLRSHGVVSAISTVVRMPGGPYGVIGGYATEPHPFGEDDVVFLRSIGNLIGAWLARRGVERALRASEVEARLAFSAGRMGSWSWDLATGRVSWSPEMEAVYGLDPGAFGGSFDEFVERIHPDDRAAAVEAIGTAASSEQPFSLEHRVVRPDGRVLWLDGRGAPVRDADGRVTGWVGVGIDVTDRKQAENELAEREQETRLALAAGRMGFWRWDSRTGEGTWSPELEDLVGVDRGSYDGTWESFIAPILAEDGPLLRDVIGASAVTGEEFAVGYRIRRSDGKLRWIETRGRPIEDGEWIGVSIDVTEQRKVQEALLQANAQLEETVARLDTLLANSPVGFAFYDEQFRFVRVNQPMADINGVPVDAHLGRSLPDLLPDVGPKVERLLRRVAATGRTVPDVEISGQTPAQPGVERHWLASYYPVPGPDGDPIGYGAMVVEITERKRLERATRLTGAVSELLAESPELDSVLARTARLMVPALADMCAIYLLPRTDVARRCVIVHSDPEVGAALLAADERWPLDIPTMLEQSADLRRGRPVVVPHVTEELRRAFARNDEQLALAERHGVTSSITAPLHVGDDIVGLMFLDFTSISGRVHQPADLGLVESLADRIVLVLERAYLTAEAQRATARLDLLNDVSELLLGALDTRARLEGVTTVVVPTFADACVAYLATPEGLQLAACKIADGDLGAVTVWTDAPATPIDGAGPMAAAFRSREPVLVSDVPADLAVALNPAERGSEADLEMRSALVVPMLADDEPLGVLVFGYSGSGRRYGDDDVALAKEIARKVAPAVEDAMRFEHELATAEALQRSLLPERLPELQDAELAARYVPGGVGLKVGGDWYDAVPLRDGRVMLAIGDVVGHGVRAAASMGKLRNVLQYGALDGLAPAALLQRLNAYFCALADADMATLFVAEYDPGRHRIRYANAGHPPAFLRHPDGAIELLDQGRGMPLCATDQARYHEAEHALSPGSLLLLYTDGLIERRGESLDAGFERLGAVLRDASFDVEDVADTVLFELLQDGAPPDDVAVLCVATIPTSDDLQLRLPASPRHLARMRKVVTDWLTAKGATVEEAREITVAVNEVAANAIEHAYGLADAAYIVVGYADGRAVEFEVRDFGRWRNRRVRGDRGRGLDLARALMDSVEVVPDDDGTLVRLRRRLGHTEEGT